MIAFLFGLVLGGCLGLLAAALLGMAHREDRP